MVGGARVCGSEKTTGGRATGGETPLIYKLLQYIIIIVLKQGNFDP